MVARRFMIMSASIAVRAKRGEEYLCAVGLFMEQSSRGAGTVEEVAPRRPDFKMPAEFTQARGQFRRIEIDFVDVKLASVVKPTEHSGCALFGQRVTPRR